MLPLVWTERTTNESILLKTNETKKLLSVVYERRWNMIGHVFWRASVHYDRRENKWQKRYRRQPITSLVKKMKSYVGFINYKEL